jgi:hypothetical protein
MASIGTRTPRTDTPLSPRRDVVGDRDIEFAVAVKSAGRDSSGERLRCHSLNGLLWWQTYGPDRFQNPREPFENSAGAVSCDL